MRVPVLAALSVALAGCAALVSDGGNPVAFVTDPPGATARTSLGQSCTTPCRLRISRLDSFTVRFEKAGFEPRTVQVFSIEDVPRPEGGIRATIGGIGVRVGIADSAPAPLGPPVGRRVHTPNPVTATLLPVAAR